VRPRLQPPTLDQIQARLDAIDFSDHDALWDELLVFYHPDTLQQLSALKKYFRLREASRSLDAVDEWIRLVALNRLTGHSNGFFSVYTLPPNQAVSLKSQRKINERRQQVPPPRNVPAILLKKSRILLSECSAALRHTLAQVAPQALL